MSKTDAAKIFSKSLLLAKDIIAYSKEKGYSHDELLIACATLIASSIKEDKVDEAIEFMADLIRRIYDDMHGVE